MNIIHKKSQVPRVISYYLNLHLNTINVKIILPEASIEELVGDHFTEITFPE